VFHGQVSNMHVRVFDRFIGLDLCENKLGMVRKCMSRSLSVYRDALKTFIESRRREFVKQSTRKARNREARFLKEHHPPIFVC
jgi:type III secretory pathway component EscR